MKHVLLFISLFAAGVHVASAQGVEKLQALSDKYGFRDAQFESPVTAFKGLVLVNTDKQTKRYARPSDSKKIGGAQVSNIYYSFYKGKLASVVLTTKGLSDSRALLEALIAQYGEGDQPNEFLQEYNWPAGRVNMTYKENTITHAAIVLFSSVPMLEQKSEDAVAAARKAGSDL